MRKRSLLVGAAVAGLALCGATGAQAVVPQVTVTPVITGLNNPRGVAVDGTGALYVASAGSYGGTDPFHLGPDVEHGLTTGLVAKYSNPASGTADWSTPVTGQYTNQNGIPEVVGASGVSASGNGCMKNAPGNREGCSLMTIVGESQNGFAEENPGVTPPAQIGELIGLNPGSGSSKLLSNVGNQQWDWTKAHSDLWEEFPDSNPYGVLVTRVRGTGRVRTFVADAGANTIVEVMPDGTNRVIAYIPNDGVRDATPTCLAQGPDGALYTGTLNLFKNGFGANPGHSDVWRVDPDTTADYLHAATRWATGLTTVTACTFDRAGNFWATEMFKGGIPHAGAVVRIPFSDPTSITEVTDASTTPFPGGIVEAPGGGMYVSINSLTLAPNSGAVVKLSAS